MKTIDPLVRPRCMRISTAVGMLFALALLPAIFSVNAYSQGRELSLADILIALRSKKASLMDRNKLLSEAVSNRGTTFSLTPEIEKELSGSGADNRLITSIRQGIAVKPTPANPNSAAVDEAAAPEPTDPAFYENRGSENVSKGDLDGAVIDFTKAIELNPSAANALLGRATVYVTRDLFTLALADLNRLIEIQPRNAAAYVKRAQVYEKKLNSELTIADFKKALEFEAGNEIAKTAVDRWNAEQKAKAPAPIIVPPVATRKPAPEFVYLGRLSEAQAIKMVKPTYSLAARQSRISGEVVVEVELDTEGNVASAKTVSGHPYLRKNSEDAAKQSRFRPAMYENAPAKGKGTVVYNFVPAATQ